MVSPVKCAFERDLRAASRTRMLASIRQGIPPRALRTPNASLSDGERWSRKDCNELASHDASVPGKGSPARQSSARVRMLSIDCSMFVLLSYRYKVLVNKRLFRI